jgi:peptide chain release factor 2
MKSAKSSPFVLNRFGAFFDLASLPVRLLQQSNEAWFLFYRRESLERFEALAVKTEELVARLGWSAPTEKDVAFVVGLYQALDEVEQRLLMTQADDHRGAFLLIQPIERESEEAHQWCQLLANMYLKYSEQRELVTSQSFSPRAEDNIPLRERTYVVEADGRFGFGLLRGESGLHRRQTRESTASARVSVWPNHLPATLTRDQVVVESVRGRPRGGNWLNYTSSAIRMTHPETQLVAYWNKERSQLRNLERALRVLSFMLRGASNEEFIRTYQVGQDPFVRDHRLGLEDGDTAAVLNGALAPFVRGYLREPLRLLLKNDF